MTCIRKLSRLLCAAVLLGGACRGVEELPPLSQVTDIRALSRVDAARKLPVRVRGVVAWQRADGACLVLNDGVQGIWVDFSLSRSLTYWVGERPPPADYQPGTLIEIEGVSDLGAYAPVILPTRMRLVGSGPQPEARRLPLERLLSGGDDCQMVEVEGVVQAVADSTEPGVVIVTLKVDGYPCHIHVQRGWEIDADALLDARVRVSGAFSPRFNLRAEMTQLKILAMGIDDFEVLTPWDPLESTCRHASLSIL